MLLQKKVKTYRHLGIIADFEFYEDGTFCIKMWESRRFVGSVSGAGVTLEYVEANYEELILKYYHQVAFK